jgi:hypothetical protein
MNSCITQLVVAYENEGMSIEQIAEDQGLELVAVKSALMQSSVKYRRDCGKEDSQEEDPTLNFSNQQLRTVNEVIFENATQACLPDGSPDYRTRQRAAEYIRDDKKGRKELRRLMSEMGRNSGNTFNILNFNEMIQQARAGASGLREKLSGNRNQEQRVIGV